MHAHRSCNRPRFTLRDGLLKLEAGLKVESFAAGVSAAGVTGEGRPVLFDLASFLPTDDFASSFASSSCSIGSLLGAGVKL